MKPDSQKQKTTKKNEQVKKPMGSSIKEKQSPVGSPLQQHSSKSKSEDRSKSFGESAMPAGSEVKKNDEDGVIPKENSFPNYESSVDDDDDNHNYTH
jgi:hypothetical protein